jgi:hypothetical protein
MKCKEEIGIVEDDNAELPLVWSDLIPALREIQRYCLSIEKAFTHFSV